MSAIGLYSRPPESSERGTPRLVLIVMASLVVLVVVSGASFLAGSFFTGAAIGYAAADQVAAGEHIEIAEAQLAELRLALMRFEVEAGRHPTEQEGLQSLTPFLVKPVPADPWGRDYIYRVTARSVTVSSLGPDGAPGNDDLSTTLR